MSNRSTVKKAKRLKYIPLAEVKQNTLQLRVCKYQKNMYNIHIKLNAVHVLNIDMEMCNG